MSNHSGFVWLKCVIIITFLVVPQFLFSQIITSDSTEAQDRQQQTIENYSEQTQSEIDITELTTGLEYYKKHPVNLNQTDFNELQDLNLLTDIQISNLLKHIEQNGKLISLYELQGIPGFDLKTIEMILPYITIGMFDKSNFSFKEMFKYGTNDVMLRYQQVLEKQSGYEKVSDSVKNASPGSYYTGSPYKLYLKYRFNYNNRIKIGLTAEKDPGEDFFDKTNSYGFDFYSGYLNINNVGIFKNIVVGDYTVQFGQGLTCWTGLGYGKGADAVGIKKIGKGISPYNSVYENGYFRGIGLSVAIKKIQISGFYSYKKVDAGISSDTSESYEAVVSSLPEDGLHNTLTRISHEKKLQEQNFGAQLSYSNRALQLGAISYYTLYDKSINKEIQPYNQFEFSGKTNLNSGIYYSYIFKNFNFFGETTMSQNMGWGTVDGFMASVNRYFSFAVLYRNYARNLQSLYSSGFGQSTQTSNEEGLYYGMVIRPHYKFTINAYADYYRYSWLKYQVNQPSYGYDMNAQLQYKPTKKILLGFRYKFEKSQRNSDQEDVVIEYTEPMQRQNYRFQFTFPASPSFNLSSRIEVNSYKKGNSTSEWGYFISQDIRYKSNESRFSGSFRFSIFHTPSYNSRIYAYENDVLYAYSLPSFYDKGLRYYIILQYKIIRNLDVWVRFAQTSYQDKKVISSGLNEINGNKQSEIKLQLRYKF